MKQEVLGLVRENAVESTAIFGPAGAIVKMMLASVLMQVLLLEREVTKERRKRSRRA